MPFSVKQTEIPDVLIIEPKVYSDSRGYFFESYNKKDFIDSTGIKANFVQDNQSLSVKGILRGLHYQLNQTQGKLVRVNKGAVFDVAVDLRKSSKTYGMWVGVELTADNKKQLWIPPGFAHGFMALAEQTEFLYKTTDYWDPASECCLRWNDENINIKWPDIGMEPILNDKDQLGLSWFECPKFDS